MKKHPKINVPFLLSLFFLFFVSCSDDDGVDIPTVSENIVQLAVANTNLTTLVSALERADLVSALDGSGPFTVMAPTNTAFNTFLVANGFSNIDQVPVGFLKQLLLNHVLQGQFRSTDFVGFKTGYASTLADGITPGKALNIFFNADQGVDGTGANVISFNGAAKIIPSGANKQASNGMIHEVDAVIGFATVANFIVFDENLAAMEAAMKTQGQPDFVSLLNTPMGTGQAPFTVFVPTNPAFLLLPPTTDGDLLTAVVNHHIIPGNNLLSQNITNGLVSPPTLEGDSLLFSVSGSSISMKDGLGNVDAIGLVLNLQASNGVVHLIDRVLIPDTSN